MKRKFKRRVREKKGTPQWMVTYSDMVTLILVFFILLFSMSQIDAEKLKAVADSYRERVIFDFYPSPIKLDETTQGEDETDSKELRNSGQDEFDQEDRGQVQQIQEVQKDELDRLLNEVQAYLEANGLSEVITANRTERGVVLVLQENVLFESAQAVLINDALPFLDKVSTLLENIPNHIKVEGHTDSRPINTFRYPSNWELSGARASSVVRYFVEEKGLSATRFQIAGYADTRPVAPNDSSNNMQQNRRVEIVILESE